MALVFRVVGTQSEIFDSIIIGNPVDMVDNLAPQENSTQEFFHYKAVFENIAVTFCIRMILFANKNIAIRIQFFSAFPVIGFGASFHRHSFAHLFRPGFPLA